MKTKAIASARIKTDKIDSRTLADLSRANLVAEPYKPDIKTRYLRELMRGRSFMVNLRTGLKNRVHSILVKVNVKNPYSDLFGIGGMGFLESLALPGVYRDSLDSYLEVIGSLNGEIAEAEKKATRALDGSPEARLLSTIPRGRPHNLTDDYRGDRGRIPLRLASTAVLLRGAGPLHLAVGRDHQARTDNQAGLRLAALRAGGGVQARGREARPPGGFLRQAGQTQG